MGIIKNESDIATNENREHILEILKAGLKRACPHSILNHYVRYNAHFNSLSIHNKTYDLLKGRIFVIGGGKAAGYMAEALENVVGQRNITAGLVTCLSGNYKTGTIKVKPAGHPLPDRRGIKAVEKMLAMKEKFGINEKDLVVCLLSGGASALLPCPVKEISLNDIQTVSRMLLESGANMQEINTVRKHLSRVKGGQLGRHWQPAPVVSLIISDVVGDQLDVIASGPTVIDPSTFKDALLILEKYQFSGQVPLSVIKYIRQGAEGSLVETPKRLDNCDNFIIANNATALEAMALMAKGLGYRPLIVASNLKGDPVNMARWIAAEIKKGGFKKYDALILGGETSPALPKHHGKGGRNLHFAAETMMALSDFEANWAMAGISTDGLDYLTGYAGAIVDKHTLAGAREKELNVSEYLENFNSFTLLKKIGHSLIDTGATGTNVGDVAVYLYK